MKKLKSILKLGGLYMLLSATDCDRLNFATYRIENDTDHAIKIEAHGQRSYITDSLTSVFEPIFLGTIDLPTSFSIWESTIQLSRGGGGKR